VIKQALRLFASLWSATKPQPFFNRAIDQFCFGRFSVNSIQRFFYHRPVKLL
jgi:hypothetical protein